MKKSQFKGYILEDAVAKLLEDNGYILIDDIEDNIVISGNGLNLVGRGGKHQFDVLGEFRWIPPFVYPIRLFVEAKFTGKTTGIPVVREALGILVDINSNYITIDVDNSILSLPKYDYHALIASAEGFSEPAVRMALAHKIYLLDLSHDLFTKLLNQIELFTDNFFDLKANNDGHVTPEEAKAERESYREEIRLKGNEDLGYDEQNIELKEMKKAIKYEIDELGTIYLANSETSYIFPLISYENEQFKKSLKSNPHQKVSILFQDQENAWEIIPNNEEYKLRFILPKELINYIFKSKERDIENRALYTKKKHISKLTFVVDLDDQGNPTLCTLTYDEEQTLNLVSTRNNRNGKD